MDSLFPAVPGGPVGRGVLSGPLETDPNPLLVSRTPGDAVSFSGCLVVGRCSGTLAPLRGIRRLRSDPGGLCSRQLGGDSLRGPFDVAARG